MTGDQVDDDEVAVARVRDLLNWTLVELDLLSSAFRGCNEEQIGQVMKAFNVSRIPAAYHEYLRLSGQGGAGSALYEIFPGDDVAFESLVPDADWAGMKKLASDVIKDCGYRVDLAGCIVIRIHRQAEVDYIEVDRADPPVWTCGADGLVPEVRYPSVSDWLEKGIGRAIKRRFPLRDSHYKP